MLTKDQRTLVNATIKHATETHDSAAHTVAGAVLTQSGQIVLGLNAYHFLGGPCGGKCSIQSCSDSPRRPGDYCRCCLWPHSQRDCPLREVSPDPLRPKPQHRMHHSNSQRTRSTFNQDASATRLRLATNGSTPATL